MTVIAFDGRTVAADRRSVSNGVARSVTKLFTRRNDDGTVKEILAICGSASTGLELVAWYRSGADPEKFPRPTDREMDADLVVFRPDHHPMTYERGCVPVIWEERQFATGCGRDAAMAALLMGADAKRAVEIACQIDVHCGNGMDSVELYGEPDGAGCSGAAPTGEAASS